MTLKYYGHSCFSMTFSDGIVLVTDPFDASVGYPLCDAACDAALVSHGHFDHNYTQSLSGAFRTISAPGEYAVGGVKIAAMPSFHDKKKGALRGKNLLFRIEGDGLAIAHLGDLGHLPNREQADFLKNLDLLLLPIGGTYTIDADEAREVLRMLKPRHAVAMHYRTDACSLDIADCAAFARDTGAQRMPRTLELDRERLSSLPAVMILDYKD